MNEPGKQLTFTLDPVDNARLANLCGPLDENLHQLERRLGVRIQRRGSLFTVTGGLSATESAGEALHAIYAETKQDLQLSAAKVHQLIQLAAPRAVRESSPNGQSGTAKAGYRSVKPRGVRQAAYVGNLASYDLNFAIGPAGTGKTYLAVSVAVQALIDKQVNRIVLVRPAVEAGEKLGFLPGDLAQKVDPYLRPMYDALYEMLGVERVTRLLDQGGIEVAPLAYMRGRTLNESFIILDEAQNTTPEQMKMFLTRIGFGSSTVVTGDVTQVDLPVGQLSGLRHAREVLDGVEGIAFNYFTAADVVRHPLVQRVVEAYERHAD